MIRCLLVMALALVACRDGAPTRSASTADGRCHDGWNVTKRAWHGTVRETVTFTCEAGVPVMNVGGRGLEAGSRLREVSPTTWQRMWKHLEKAGWRRIAAHGVEKPDVEIEITDGTVTKTLGWREPIHLSDQELDVNIAIEVAFTLEDI